MRKLISWCKDHVLLLATLFLLAFIPLYPKLPLIDIKHTWVYVRAEDFVVLLALGLWGVFLVRKKITLQTPLTIPILLFWLAGLVATIHGVSLVLPAFGETPANVSFLSYLRRIEYMSVFFVAYFAMREQKFLKPVVAVLVGTVLAVSLYGLGQKYAGLPAYLTMNEEFAKGIAIRLSSLSRLSSTFGGHYDLAAWLVLTIPILASVFFAFRNALVRIALAGTIALGLVVLFFTVSRVSLFALVVALGIVVYATRRKFFLWAIPATLLVAVALVAVSPKIVERFASTLTQTEVLVDATTGEAIGHTTNVANTYFADKVVKQAFSRNIKNLYAYATPSAAVIIPHTKIEGEVVLFREPNAPTGENLPQGTGYVNLTLAPVVKKLENFYFEPTPKVATTSSEVFIINGNFLLKQAYAYDLSFTTRFQGEWPRALAAFKRNILFGSGYGSVGLAVDNSYLRMLAEIGLLGFGAFVGIFIAIGLAIRQAMRHTQPPLVRNFLIGFGAGAVGLAVNALFIDVFEASKVAFSLWILTGVVLGLVRLYDKNPPSALRGFVTMITSPFAIVVYLLSLTVILYGAVGRNTFIADDYTWLRWASEGRLDGATVWRYFTAADGFFFRPGTKLYFLFMYHTMWLNQSVYHAVSLGTHFITSVLVFFLARKIFRNLPLAAAAGGVFLLLSGLAETVVWISATGHLFASAFTLAGLLSYVAWDERKGRWAAVGAFVFAVLSLLFHEFGIVTPFLYVLYAYTKGNVRRVNWAFFTPLPLYLAVRYLAGSHWLSGDYNYNLLKLPLNAVGNLLSYAALGIIGPLALPLTASLRVLLRQQLPLSALIGALILLVLYLVFRLYRKALSGEERSTITFAVWFFAISLLPFLGLGNASARYVYLASAGIALIFVWGGQKLYTLLSASGRTIAGLGMATIVGTYIFYQMMTHQQVRQDWSIASDKARNFLITMQANYHDRWANSPVEFHLVNVPIRQGEAWVFPVGLPDAVRLMFGNPQAEVYTWTTVDEALAAVEYGSTYQYVFEFDKNGKLVKHEKPLPPDETN